MAEGFDDQETAVLAGQPENDEEAMALTSLASSISEKYQAAKRNRLVTEQRWMAAHDQFRGVFKENFTATEKSKATIKITKTKTLAGYGQIIDILFGQGKVPLEVQATEKPTGIAKEITITAEAQQEGPEIDPEDLSIFGYEGDGKDLQPGDTVGSRVARIGEALKQKLKGIPDEHITEDPSAVGIKKSPAQEAAEEMDETIQDQLTEADAQIELRKSMLQAAILGAGCIKGPFITEKEYPNWRVPEVDEGPEGELLPREYDPIFKIVPDLEYRSVWDIYPDPNCTTAYDAEYIIDRHLMSASQIRLLKKQPGFIADQIDEAISTASNYVAEWWEHNLREDLEDQTHDNRFEVLEYWGIESRENLEDEGFDIPENLEDADDIQVNVWMLNGVVIRMVMNPFRPKRIPYIIYPLEVDLYNIWGVGIPENMEDSQRMVNGFTRMSVDNAVLSGNIMIEVDENNLMPGQDMSVYPGKVWRRRGGAPGQAIFSTSFKNITPELMQLIDKFIVFADQSTGIPSFAHGQTGVQGVGRTASGISQLLGAASVTIKTIIKNFDDYLFAPLGQAMFAFNMQYNRDLEVRGDLAIKAMGTESLIQKEVRANQLISFFQIAQQSPFLNQGAIIKEIAKALDIEESKLLNDPELQQVIQMIQQGGQPGGGPVGPQQGATGGMAPPVPAQPGQEGFPGQPQQQGAPVEPEMPPQ